ncbi:unnamed protein product, partial [Mesorhabditis spiculigera]
MTPQRLLLAKGSHSGREPTTYTLPSSPDPFAGLRQHFEDLLSAHYEPWSLQEFSSSPPPTCSNEEMEEYLRHQAENPLASTWCHHSVSSSPDWTPFSTNSPPSTYTNLSLDLNVEYWNTTTATNHQSSSKTYYLDSLQKRSTKPTPFSDQLVVPTPQIRRTESSAKTAVGFSLCPPSTEPRLLVPDSQDNPILCDLTPRILTHDTPQYPTHKPYRRHPRKMEWQQLESDELVNDDLLFNDPFTLPDRVIENLVDEDVVDIRELDAYLYPGDAATNPILPPAAATTAAQTLTSTVEAYGFQEDPFTEFFLPDDTMPPHTSNHQHQHHQEKPCEVFVEYAAHEYEFMETAQELEQYCKRDSASMSPISIGSPEASTSESTSGPIRVEPRRFVPASSSPYSDVDPVTDYRQKRDKNNVASARSRQKRQNKFHEMKKECNDLELRNVELRATLDTLEKSVAEYKNIMLAFMNKP